SVAFRAAFAFADNLAVLALSRGITGVTPSRVAPGVLGSGNFPGLASLQPSGTLAIRANSAIKKRQRLKFGLLSDKNTPDRWTVPATRDPISPAGDRALIPQINSQQWLPRSRTRPSRSLLWR